MSLGQMKRTGMRWSVCGARKILAQRMRRASDTWGSRPAAAFAAAQLPQSRGRPLVDLSRFRLIGGTHLGEPRLTAIREAVRRSGVPSKHQVPQTDNRDGGTLVGTSVSMRDSPTRLRFPLSRPDLLTHDSHLIRMNAWQTARLPDLGRLFLQLGCHSRRLHVQGTQ